MDITCPTSNECLIVGEGGTILTSADRGSRWEAQSSGTGQWLDGIACLSSSTCLVVGEAGTILATTDGGTSWTSYPSSTADDLNAIACPTSTTCVAVGGKFQGTNSVAGTILTSTLTGVVQ